VAERPDRTKDGFPITYDEFKGVTVEMPKVCPHGCGMDVTNYYDMHVVFHHPELRRIPVTAPDKKSRKRKK
jgi:hypothetical protein